MTQKFTLYMEKNVYPKERVSKLYKENGGGRLLLKALNGVLKALSWQHWDQRGMATLR